jgi:hypothetical protein
MSCNISDTPLFNAMLIADSLTADKNKTLLDSFKELYDNGFPDADEREDFAMIFKRLSCENEIPRSAIVVHHESNALKQASFNLLLQR